MTKPSIKSRTPFIFNKLVFYLFFSMIIIFGQGCSKQQEDTFEEDSIDYDLREVDRIKLIVPEGEVFGSLSISKHIYDNQIIALDLMTTSFLIFDLDGNFKKRFGKRGRGPGEFALPAILCENDDYVYITDVNQFKISVFDHDFNHIRDHEIGGQEVFFVQGPSVYCNNDFLYMGILESKYSSVGELGKNQISNSSLLVKVDLKSFESKYLGKYHEHLENLFSKSTWPVFAFDTMNNRIYAGHQNTYKINVYDYESYELKKEFGKQSPNYHFQQTNPNSVAPFSLESRSVMAEQSSNLYYFISPDSKKLYVYFENISEEEILEYDSNESQYFLLVYDIDTQNLLAEIELPYVLAGYESGKFLLRVNDNPDNYTLAWYELHLN